MEIKRPVSTFPPIDVLRLAVCNMHINRSNINDSIRGNAHLDDIRYEQLIGII